MKFCPGKIEAGCDICQNFFFSECLGGDTPKYIPRMSGDELKIFAVQLSVEITKEAIVNVYAQDEGTARMAVEADLESNRGYMMDEAVEGEENSFCRGDVDVHVFTTTIAHKGEYVAYDGKVYSVSDFKDMISNIKIDEGEKLPSIAEA